jgi:hypothetical protein
MFWFQYSDEKGILPTQVQKGCQTMSTTDQPGRSHLLFLAVVRLIVEKHGGHLQINEKENTFTVTIAEDQKNACFRELKEAVGPLEQIREAFTTLQ